MYIIYIHDLWFDIDLIDLMYIIYHIFKEKFVGLNTDDWQSVYLPSGDKALCKSLPLIQTSPHQSAFNITKGNWLICQFPQQKNWASNASTGRRARRSILTRPVSRSITTRSVNARRATTSPATPDPRHGSSALRVGSVWLEDLFQIDYAFKPPKLLSTRALTFFTISCLF